MLCSSVQADFVIGRDHCRERFGEHSSIGGRPKVIKDVAKVVETLGLGSDKLVVIDDEATKCAEAGSLSASCLIVPALAGVESDDQVTMLLDIVAGLEAIAGHTRGSAQEAMANCMYGLTMQDNITALGGFII